MQKEFRFVYFTAVDISIDNGAGINEREFVKELMQNYGDKVICMLPHPSNPQNYNNKNIEYVTNHKGHRLLNWLSFIFSSYMRILRIRKEFRIRAIVLRLDIIPITEFLMCFLGIPIILKTLAGGTFKAKKIIQTIKDIGAPLRNRIIKMAWAGDAVGFTSKRWMVETYNFDAEHIEVIQNAANVDFFTPGSRNQGRVKLGLDDSKNVVGYVGALRKISCISMLMHAFAGLGKDTYLVLVGAGPERTSLEALASKLKIAERVIFTGNVPYNDVPILIRSFDVAVDLTASPIKIKNKVVNGSYSQKIPQYLACGIPVVAWDLEDTQFLKKNRVGSIIQEGNTVELTSALSFITNLNGPETANYKARARQFAERQMSFAHLTKKRVQFWEAMTK